MSRDKQQEELASRSLFEQGVWHLYVSNGPMGFAAACGIQTPYSNMNLPGSIPDPIAPMCADCAQRPGHIIDMIYGRGYLDAWKELGDGTLTAPNGVKSPNQLSGLEDALFAHLPPEARPKW